MTLTALIALPKAIIMWLYAKKDYQLLDSLAGYVVLQTILSFAMWDWLSLIVAGVSFIPVVGFAIRRFLFLGTAKHIWFIIVMVLTILKVILQTT